MPLTGPSRGLWGGKDDWLRLNGPLSSLIAPEKVLSGRQGSIRGEASGDSSHAGLLRSAVIIPSFHPDMISSRANLGDDVDIRLGPIEIRLSAIGYRDPSPAR